MNNVVIVTKQYLFTSSFRGHEIDKQEIKAAFTVLDTGIESDWYNNSLISRFYRSIRRQGKYISYSKYIIY